MHRVLYAVLLVSVLLVDGWVLALSGEDKRQDPRPGEKLVSSTNDQGSVNSNAQWLADPERGWLRAEERYDFDKRKPFKIDYESNRFQGAVKRVSEANKKGGSEYGMQIR